MPSDQSRTGRRKFIKDAGALLAAAASSRWTRPAWGTPQPSPRPNILIIVADDQRNDTIAALANSHIRTPNLDRLVRGGFAFRRARCMGSQVGAVCIAARAMLHTGRTLFRAPHELPARFATMAEVFRRAGYATFGCGKWHNEPPSFARGFAGGGSIFFGGMNTDQYRVRIHDFDPAGRYERNATHVKPEFSSELFADAAVDFLHGYRRDEPFLCYAAFTSPHDPRTPPPPFATMYDPAAMPLPPNFLPRHAFDNGELRIRDELLAPFPRTPENTRRQLCDYYGMISSQDAQVGRILQALHESGRAENTIIVYTGDHGLAIGSHGLFGKQNVYEHSVGIPMILHGPTIPAGRSSDAFVYGFDLYPTLCEMTGVGPPLTVEGKSLAAIIGQKADRVRDSAFSAYIHPAKPPGQAATQHAVNDGRWKLIRYRVDGKRTMQLFDLENDPAEAHDLSSDAAARRQITRLERLLTQWRHDLDEKPEWAAT